MRYVVFDVELEKGPPPPVGKIEGVEYLDSWDDKASMKASVVCAYDSAADQYRVFAKDNLLAFLPFVGKDTVLVGFNSKNFDSQVLLQGHGIDLTQLPHFDILQEMIMASGRTHKGLSLDAVTRANLPGQWKPETGDIAPVRWQRGQIGAVIDYCLHDVWLTKCLYEKVLTYRYLLDPISGKPLLIAGLK
ncbi:MAG: hypothetical protein HC801_10470 [Nitrospira sp.]|nr:hypothetical protein [Nitrospira sp.]